MIFIPAIQNNKTSSLLLYLPPSSSIHQRMYVCLFDSPYLSFVRSYSIIIMNGISFSTEQTNQRPNERML